jgi:hypothetical protein
MRVRWFQIGDQHIHLMPAAQADPVSLTHVTTEMLGRPLLVRRFYLSLF